jgi:hypothetical protein
MKSSRSQSVDWIAQRCLVLLAFTLSLATPNQARAGLAAFLLNGSAPDGNGVFSSARAPVLNDVGQLSFMAGLSATAGGNTSSDRQGLFRREADGMLTQVARGGQAGPGGGEVFTYFGETSWLNNAGDVAFQQQGNLTGIYRGTPLVKIARVSEAAPVSGTFSSLRFGGMNDAGQIAFHASMSNATPTGANRAIYRGDGASLVEIARTGSPVPGGAGTFSSLELYTKINEEGEVAFSGSAISPNLGPAIFRGDGVNTAVIARLGQPAPALGGGTDGAYGGALPGKPLSINDDGQVAFTLPVVGSSSGSTAGLFRGDGEQAAMILRSGLAAPNASGGTTGTFLSWDRPVVNNNGEVIVWAQLQGTPGGSTDNAGLFVGDGSSLRQIARSGDPAPDGNGRLIIYNRNSIINDAGQTVFHASHSGAAGRTSGGIYFHDPKLGLLTVARAGQSLFGSTIGSLMLAGNLDTPVNDMETSGLNRHGQVAFQFQLANGAHGLAIWNPPNSDFNDDGLVNGDDLAAWTANYGKTPATLADGDGNGDNVVDGVDFLMWQRQATVASSGAVNGIPEPNAALLTILATTLLLQRRKR